MYFLMFRPDETSDCASEPRLFSLKHIILAKVLNIYHNQFPALSVLYVYHDQFPALPFLYVYHTQFPALSYFLRPILKYAHAASITRIPAASVINGIIIPAYLLFIPKNDAAG